MRGTTELPIAAFAPLWHHGTMITVRELARHYGHIHAVKNVSFSLPSGQILGFLGPNGAGKTTIMKILAGYHFPSAGEAFIDGISVQENPVEVKKRTGYLPETVPLYGDMTVREYLSFIARARLMPPGKIAAAAERCIELCGLPRMADRGISTLSKGYRQRVGLAQAIIHDPPILILDEPTTGLDPNQIIEIRSLIKELGKSKTVILSTHILQEVEAVCSQVLILSEGRIAAQGRPEEIAATLKGGGTWDLLIKGADGRNIDAEMVRGKIEKFALSADFDLSSLVVKNHENGTVSAGFLLSGDGISAAPEGEQLFDWAVLEGFKLLEMNHRKLSLEDIFVQLTGEAPAGAARNGSAVSGNEVKNDGQQ
jgi:ABC-2 type transport system ATP-binding protein